MWGRNARGAMSVWDGAVAVYASAVPWGFSRRAGGGFDFAQGKLRPAPTQSLHPTDSWLLQSNRSAQHRPHTLFRSHLQKSASIQTFSHPFKATTLFHLHPPPSRRRRPFLEAPQDRLVRPRLLEQVAIFAVERF